MFLISPKETFRLHNTLVSTGQRQTRDTGVDDPGLRVILTTTRSRLSPSPRSSNQPFGWSLYTIQPHPLFSQIFRWRENKFVKTHACSCRVWEACDGVCSRLRRMMRRAPTKKCTTTPASRAMPYLCKECKWHHSARQRNSVGEPQPETLFGTAVCEARGSSHAEILSLRSHRHGIFSELFIEFLPKKKRAADHTSQGMESAESRRWLFNQHTTKLASDEGTVARSINPSRHAPLPPDPPSRANQPKQDRQKTDLALHACVAKLGGS